MSYAVLFAGQGSQHPDMMPWLSPAPNGTGALAVMERSLGTSWRETLKSEVLRGENRFAQPLVTGTSLAAWEALQPFLPHPPSAVAGYSVGEIAAFSCAGVLSVSLAMALVSMRADLMSRATDGRASGLLSVSGLTVEKVLQQFPTLSCAIVLDLDHAIYGALTEALDRAQLQLIDAGATCKRLGIDVASHTPLMSSATVAFSQVLTGIDFSPPSFPIVINAGATLCRRTDELKSALSAQISLPVDWASCMDALAEMGIECVLEVGPGRALAAMWNRRYPEIPARSLEDFRDPNGAARWLERSSA